LFGSADDELEGVGVGVEVGFVGEEVGVGVGEEGMRVGVGEAVPTMVNG
jgi:hypothetical protein